MSCALEKLELLEDEEPVLEPCRQNLSKAIFLMDEYDRTWHSIRWLTADVSKKVANAALKRSTRHKLNQLAFDAYKHFRQATKSLNLYVDVLEARDTNGEEVSIPKYWGDILRSLYVADGIFEEEHKHQIIAKQLSLF
jgi:hypothetical protein